MEHTLDLFFEENLFECQYNLSLLDYYAQQGFMFLNTRQVQSVLNKTYGQIRYAIFNYELDAFLIAGDYRMTHQAVRDYIDSKQEEYESLYHYIMSRRELSGIYDAAMGYDLAKAVRAIKTKRYPITAIDSLLEKDKTFEYDNLPCGTTIIRDCYDVDSLNLPEEARIGDWATLLNVPVNKLMLDLKVTDSFYLIPFKTFKEYLVSSELVNLNIPIQEWGSQSEKSEVGQLELF